MATINDKEIRLLTADEIDVRVARTTTYNNGKTAADLLLYKDARVDMRMLDELVGPMNWEREHKLVGDRLYCKVSIYDSTKNAWISKEDVGVESNTEAEKGQASDAFKRACFNWGIGRELYTAPRITVELGEKDLNKGKCSQTFTVQTIKHDKKGNINELVLLDKWGKVRFEWKNGKTTKIAAPEPAAPEQPANEPDIAPGCSQEMFDNLVKASAEGKTMTKTGRTMLEYYVHTYAATAHQQQVFNNAVDYYRVNHNL